MKKFALLVAAVLATLSLQAVTIEWSNLTLAGPHYQTGASGSGPGWCGLFIVAGDGSTLTRGDLNSAITVTGNTTVTLHSSLGALAQVNVSGTNTYAKVNEGGDPYKLADFSTTFDLTGDTVTFVLFNKYNLEGDNSSAGYALLTVEGIKADTTTVDLAGTMLEWAKGAVNHETVTVTVPEPTVLALLALGVAGVALRRRA